MITSAQAKETSSFQTLVAQDRAQPLQLSLHCDPKMKRQTGWSLLVMLLFGLAGKSPGQLREAQASQPSAEKEQPAARVDAEPGLILASADRVYLDADLGTMVPEGFGRYSSHPSGRGAPNAKRAHAELQKAIAQWGRFTVVDDPGKADLILVIVEGNRNSGVREGVLTERLLVLRGGSERTAPLWQSKSHDGGVRDYRPVAKAVEEFRAAVEEYEKNIPRELVAEARAKRKAETASGGCGAAPADPLDCLAHGNTVLYLQEDCEENRGAVKLSEAVLGKSLLDVGKYISTTDFSNYVVAIQKLLHQQFTAAERQAGKDIALEGTLQPDGKADFKLASRPLVDEQQMEIFYNSLLRVPRPTVHEGPVEFRAVFLLWGGSEESQARP